MGSLIGAFIDADIQGFRDNKVIRIKVGVRDHNKIPAIAELTEVPLIYHIHFELEQVIEEGGYLCDGVLVSAENYERQSQDPGSVRHNKKAKNCVTEGQNSGGGGKSDQSMGGQSEEVDGSQMNVDKETEENLRKVMLEKKKMVAEEKKQR